MNRLGLRRLPIGAVACVPADRIFAAPVRLACRSLLAIRWKWWSEKEDAILVPARAQVGRHWEEITKRLDGRNKSALISHWRGVLKSKPDVAKREAEAVIGDTRATKSVSRSSLRQLPDYYGDTRVYHRGAFTKKVRHRQQCLFSLLT